MAANRQSERAPERSGRKHPRASATEFCNRANARNGAAVGAFSLFRRQLQWKQEMFSAETRAEIDADAQGRAKRTLSVRQRQEI
jgi:hypothetical protein